MEWDHAVLSLNSWIKWRKRRRRSRRKKKKVVVVLMMMTNGIKGKIHLAPLGGCYEYEPSDSIKHEECPYQTMAISC
jgi:hypothetical protein